MKVYVIQLREGPVLVEDLTLEQAKEAIHYLADELQQSTTQHQKTLDLWRSSAIERRAVPRRWWQFW